MLEIIFVFSEIWWKLKNSFWGQNKIKDVVSLVIQVCNDFSFTLQGWARKNQWSFQQSEDYPFLSTCDQLSSRYKPDSD